MVTPMLKIFLEANCSPKRMSIKGRKHPLQMKDNMMTQIQTEHSNTARLLFKLSATMALAISIGTSLQAQETVVKGNVRSDLVQQRVATTGLNLSELPSQLILISRVKRASDRVCNIIHHGEHPMAKFESRCTQKIYSDAKPQIDLAIANAQTGKQVAISLVVARSR